MPTRILLRFLRAVLALLLALAGVRAGAEPGAPLRLGSGAALVDAWPAATLLVDAEGTLTPERALASQARFTHPAAPHANLGVQREPVWLRVPLHVAAGDPGQWVFSVEYPSIDRVDVHLVSGGRIVHHVALGRGLPFSERPMPSAFPAVTAPLFAADLIGYRTTQTIATVIGTLPLLLAIPIAYQRAHLERDALHALAHTDALTGLPNRRGLQDALDAALPGCTPVASLAVFLLDLDGFKPINDRLGHDAGDELLVLVARRLKGLVRAGDLVARLGGDEFVVVVGSIPGDAEARAIGQKMLDQFRLPFEVAGQTCRVGLTIGYALAPQDGRDAASLLKRADAAMYAGKQAGRHCLKRGGASLAMAGA